MCKTEQVRMKPFNSASKPMGKQSTPLQNLQKPHSQLILISTSPAAMIFKSYAMGHIPGITIGLKSAMQAFINKNM